MGVYQSLCEMGFLLLICSRSITQTVLDPIDFTAPDSACTDVRILLNIVDNYDLDCYFVRFRVLHVLLKPF